jgi:hemolysin III
LPPLRARFGMPSSRAEVVRGLTTGAFAEPPLNGKENTSPGVACAAALPTLRGFSHAIAFLFAIAAAIVVVALAPTARATVGLGVYGATLVALFGGSALYHRWRGPVRFKSVLQRIDHSTIFVFIAASMTPIALVILHGALAWVTLAIAWTGAAAGVAFSLGWVSAPRALTAGSYLLLGWVAVIMLPQVLGELTITPLLLLAAGGLLYSAGAIVYATQRPNPWPRTFGFHEVFHAFVIAAAAVHYVAILGWVLPAAR